MEKILQGSMSFIEDCCSAVLSLISGSVMAFDEFKNTPREEKRIFLRFLVKKIPFIVLIIAIGIIFIISLKARGFTLL